MKLHLGCGEYYLNGYVNIDYPKSKQTVINTHADIYTDILKLTYRNNSIDEVRLHHVFEHFDRSTAIALLVKWRKWLKVGGVLRIETPDAMSCYKMMISPLYTYDQKQQINRHLFGSHEASWAVHWDGWYEEKYKHILQILGYENLQFKRNKWGVLRNIEVFAHKSRAKMSYEEYRNRAEKILIQSTVRVNQKDNNYPKGSEIKTLRHWMSVWEKIIST